MLFSDCILKNWTRQQPIRAHDFSGFWTYLCALIAWEFCVEIVIYHTKFPVQTWPKMAFWLKSWFTVKSKVCWKKECVHVCGEVKLEWGKESLLFSLSNF